MCPGLVPVTEMAGRVSPWFGIVVLGPAISVTSIVNRGVVSLNSSETKPPPCRLRTIVLAAQGNGPHDVVIEVYGTTIEQ